MKTVLFILLLAGYLTWAVSADSYYIIPSSHLQACFNSSKVPCFTLSQFANESNARAGYFVSNLTLILFPGYHTLDTEFHVRGANLLKMFSGKQIESNSVLSNERAVVVCSSYAKFTFEGIEQLFINKIAFVGCAGSSMMDLTLFSLAHSTFYATEPHETQLKVSNTKSAVVIASLFSTLKPLVTISPGILSINSSFVTVVNSSFTENRVANKSVLFLWNSTVRVENSVFSNNSAGLQSSILYFDNSTLDISNNCVFVNNACLNSTIIGCALHGINSTVFINDTLFRNQSSSSIGAILMLNSFISINSSVFFNNKALISGATHVINSSLVISNSYFVANKAVLHCGAICITANSTAIVDKVSFLGNIARGPGGALYVQSSSMHIFNATCTRNVAIAHDGGVIHAKFNSTIVIRGSVFFSNVAEHGGAGYVEAESIMDLKQCNFSKNSADEGSAIFVYQSTIKSKGCVFSENTAGAGTVSAQNSTIVVTNDSFVNNTGNGSIHLAGCGGIVSYQCIVAIKDTVFDYNKGVHNGAIVSFAGRLIVEYSSFSHNKNSAIVVVGVNITIHNVRFLNNSNSFLHAGGAFSVANSIATISNSQFFGNKVAHSINEPLNTHQELTNVTRRSYGLATDNDDSYDLGGAITIINSMVIIINCQFSKNTVNCSFCRPPNSSQEHATCGGGALSIISSSAIINSSQFAKNMVLTDFFSGLCKSSEEFSEVDVLGGAIYAMQSNITIEMTKLSQNRVGEIRTLSRFNEINMESGKHASFNTDSVYMRANEVNQGRDIQVFGGSICAFQSKIMMKRITFKENSCGATVYYNKFSMFYGGALFASDSNVTLKNTTFIKNSILAMIALRECHFDEVENQINLHVYVYGGAIGIRNSIARLNDTSLSQNKAHYITLDIDIGLDNYSNISCRQVSSESSGGALFTDSSVLAVHNTTLTNNKAIATYNAMGRGCNNASLCTVNKSNITEYVSGLQAHGGAVYIRDGTSSFQNCTFS